MCNCSFFFFNIISITWNWKSTIFQHYCLWWFLNIILLSSAASTLLLFNLLSMPSCSVCLCLYAWKPDRNKMYNLRGISISQGCTTTVSNTAEELFKLVYNNPLPKSIINFHLTAILLQWSLQNQQKVTRIPYHHTTISNI